MKSERQEKRVGAAEGVMTFFGKKKLVAKLKIRGCIIYGSFDAVCSSDYTYNVELSNYHKNLAWSTNS
jgi:hypothetical protein